MNKIIASIIVGLASHLSFSQELSMDFENIISKENPYGKVNPAAPRSVGDYEPLIGICDCKSISRKADQSWAEPIDMTWTFKYIMNGMAVQDETLKADGAHSGSIRQYNADSARWYVHYYSTSGATPTLAAWEGNLQDNGEMILYREQQSPNGLDGFFKIRFYDISQEGFKWLGAWVTTDESFSYETWKIACTKRK